MAERTGRSRIHARRRTVAAAAGACALALVAVAGPPGRGAAARSGTGGTATAPPRVRPVSTGSTSSGPHGTYVLSGQKGCDTSYPSLNPAGGTTDGPAVERIRRRGFLTVGVDQNSYLWGFRNPGSGQLAGFDIDIVRAIAKDLLGDPDKVRYVALATNDREQAIKDHTVDMVVRTTTIDCDRIKDMAFSVPYFEAGQQVLALKTSPVTGFDSSLKGRTVCVARSSTGEELLTQHPQGEKILRVANQLDCLVRIQLGLADAVITDDALAAGQAAQDPAVHLVGGRLTDEMYGVAMNLDAPDLVRRVNQVLAAYVAGGARSAWTRSYDTWLAPHLTEPEEPPKQTYR
jgi:polar amino acid transport system substrate-binding protein